MVETTLSKVGNSMAVLLPKALRSEAGINPEDKLQVTTPRKGVVVITAVAENANERLARLKAAQERIDERAGSFKPWPQGKTADDVIEEGRKARVNKLLSL